MSKMQLIMAVQEQQLWTLIQRAPIPAAVHPVAKFLSLFESLVLPHKTGIQEYLPHIVIFEDFWNFTLLEAL